MKIVVIGTLNKDLILPFQDAPIESFGGIFYNISVLSELLGPDDEIVPVSFLGEDIEITVKAVLEKRQNISLDGLITVPEKNHKVILEYTGPDRRQEKSLFQFPPLEWNHIKSHLKDADMIMVNMVSGWDLSLSAYQKLSKNYYERLYTDIHYLVMDIDNLGRRTLKLPDRMDEWLAGSKFIQMNEDEFGVLAAESRNEVDFFQKYFKKDQTFICTRSKNGATLTYNRNKMVRQKPLAPYIIRRIIDATGCGDTFSSALVAKYVESGDIKESADYANLAAAANALLRGTNEMHRLISVMSDLREEASVRDALVS